MVLIGDQTIIDMMRPNAAIPAGYNMEVLMLGDIGISMYEKPKEEDKKAVHNQCVAYGKLHASMKRGNSRIFTAILSKLGPDLLLHIDSNRDLKKGDGHATYDYLITRFMKGGASSIRLKINAFHNVDFTSGDSVQKLFADVLKTQNEANSHGSPREIKSITDKINAATKMLSEHEKRPEAQISEKTHVSATKSKHHLMTWPTLTLSKSRKNPKSNQLKF